MSQKQYIKIEKKEGIFLIGLNRPEERNAINTEMILQLSDALTQYEDDSNSRCAVLYAEEAYRLGLVQEIVPKKNLLESAIQLAKKIAEQAPLSIKATLENSRKYVMEGEGEATKNLVSITAGLLKSQDGKEGIQSFLQKRKANFVSK